VKVLKRSWLLPAALLGALVALPTLARAAAPTPTLVQDEEGGEEEEADDEDSVEEEDRWFAVVGGDVHTGTGAVLRGATVLANKGVIEEIGYDLTLPEDCEVLDATGYRVYPGLVAISVSSSIVKASGGAPAPDFDHVEHVPGGPGGSHAEPQEPPAPGAPGSWEREVLAELGVIGWSEPDPAYEVEPDVEGASKLEDSYDPFGWRLTLTLSTGITTVGNGSAAMKLRRDTVTDVVMNDKGFISLAYTDRSPTGKASLREKLESASKYLREYRIWQDRVRRNKDLEEPSTKGVDKNIVAVLTGETRAKFRANDREDLLEIARLAQEFGFRPVIDGCGEGWTVASELGRAGALAIVTPRMRSTKAENLVRAGGSSIENAAILHEHGVQVAVTPGNESIDLGGITGRDLLHLPIEAGFAVRGGLSNQAALEAITIVPARILGVDHRVGSLEVGKDCDLIVTDGDVLHYQTFVQYAVVAGRIAYDKQDELFFRHIRPRPEPEPEAAPADQADADEATDEAAEESADENDGEDGDDEDAEDDDSGDEDDDGGDEEEGGDEGDDGGEGDGDGR